MTCDGRTHPVYAWLTPTLVGSGCISRIGVETALSASGQNEESHGQLRREITTWGSFTWGYADVGADVYVALGLVLATAEGLANLAFLIAGLVYVTVGLAYTELAAAYPLAGGGQFFVLRGSVTSGGSSPG